MFTQLLYDNIDRTAAELELIVDAISWNFNGHARCEKGVCYRAQVWLPCTRFVTDIYSSNIPRQRPPEKNPFMKRKLGDFLCVGRKAQFAPEWIILTVSSQRKYLLRLSGRSQRQ